MENQPQGRQKLENYKMIAYFNCKCFEMFKRLMGNLKKEHNA